MVDRQTAAGCSRDAATAPLSAGDLPSFPDIRQKLDGGLDAIRSAGEGLQRAERMLLELRGDLGAALEGRALPEAVAAGLARLREAAASGSGGGTNLLVIVEGDDLSFCIGSALTRDTDGALTLRPVEVDRTRTALFDDARPAGERRGLLDRAGADARPGLADLARLPEWDAGDRAAALRQLDGAMTSLKAALSHLSIARSRLDLQASFIASLCSALPEYPLPGALDVLDGDALRRRALETRRLLREQTQSIASRNRETILRLFREA